MEDGRHRVWLVTGCSSGFGAAIAKRVIARGDRLVACARDLARLSDLISLASDRVLPLRADVTVLEDVDTLVAAAVDRFGRIDVLVNNAGIGIIGAIEEVDDKLVRQVFDTNFFGLAAVTRGVLPVMRRQRQGHIIMMSSVSGLIGNPGSGIYSASKFAVEGLSEALAGEVKRFGIKVTVVEPGPFRTGFFGATIWLEEYLGAYRELLDRRRKRYADLAAGAPGDPERAAEALVRIVDEPEPPFRLVMGVSAVERVLSKIDRVAHEVRTWRSVSTSTEFESQPSSD